MSAGLFGTIKRDRNATPEPLLRPRERAILIAALIVALGGTVASVFHEREQAGRDIAQEEGALVAPGSDDRFLESLAAPGLPAPATAGSPSAPSRTPEPSPQRPRPTPPAPTPEPPLVGEILRDLPLPPPPTIPPLLDPATMRQGT